MSQKKARKSSASARRKPSSRRRPAYEDPVDRIHRVRRELEEEKKRLGLSEREWLTYIRQKNAEFEAEIRAGHKVKSRRSVDRNIRQAKSAITMGSPHLQSGSPIQLSLGTGITAYVLAYGGREQFGAKVQH